MSRFDEVFDWVVVGSGGGSMCSALLMRSLGKSVLILEKTDMVGGTTARSGGVMWIPNNRFMQRDGVPDSFEQAATYLDALGGNDPDARGATQARRHAYLREAPRMLEFLIGQGIRFDRVSDWPDYHDELPGGSKRGRTVIAQPLDVNELGDWKRKLQPTSIQSPVPPLLARLGISLPVTLPELLELPAVNRSWRVKWLALRVALRGIIAKLSGKQWVAGGGALQGRMLQAALRAGVEIRTESPVQQLITEQDAVKGVVTTRDGQPWSVGARLGVLVNAGGFARNQRMRDQYIPGTSVQWSMAIAGDTGEMIEEMMKHGAAIAQMEERVGSQQTMTPGAELREFKPGVQAMTASPHCILVDQSGARYMNEGGSYMRYCQGMLARNQSVPAIPSWAIFDSQYLQKYLLPDTLPWRKAPQSWFDSGYLKRADTLEQLARSIAVEPAALAATVERFNGFVANNRDDDFQRGERAYDLWLGDEFNNGSATLGSIEVGPFYAIPVVPGDVGTYGGVVTDEHARVLREDGSVIAGLYATGVSTASVMGRVYPGAGSSVGPSFTWGYLAARHAIGQ